MGRTHWDKRTRQSLYLLHSSLLTEFLASSWPPYSTHLSSCLQRGCISAGLFIARLSRAICLSIHSICLWIFRCHFQTMVLRQNVDNNIKFGLSAQESHWLSLILIQYEFLSFPLSQGCHQVLSKVCHRSKHHFNSILGEFCYCVKTLIKPNVLKKKFTSLLF